MLAAWMVYATLIGAVVLLGGVAAEHFSGVWRLPRRFAWTVAMAAAIVAPILLGVRASHPLSRARASNVAKATTIPGRPSVAAAIEVPMQVVARMPTRWNAIIASLWALVSATLLALFVRDALCVSRARRTWMTREIAGRELLVSDGGGPAVIGVMYPRIVVPSWAASLPSLDLLLRHEEEHIRAGDPALLASASFVAMLCPWNVALWVMVRRLRAATEIDCDARVLRATNRVRDYGALLLAVGARNNLTLPLAASLVERKSLLERRIVVMTSLRPSRPVLASIPFLGGIVFAAALVAQTPRPGRLVADRDVPGMIPTATLRAWISENQPQIANGQSASNMVGFLVDADGRLVRSVPWYDPKLNDRLQQIDSARAATTGVLGPRRIVRNPKLTADSTEAPAGVNVQSTKAPNILRALGLSGPEIGTVEGRNAFPGDLAPNAVEVLVVHLKR